MFSRTLALTLWLIGVTMLCAHPQVSMIVVEAGFGAQQQCVLRVNLDPRLILTDQPSTLPAASAAWYFKQDSAARAKTEQQARDFLKRNLVFKSGDAVVEAAWSFTAIDGNSNFPLTPNSAEAHLLATFTVALPEKAGGFTITLDARCAVGLILLNSITGNEERRPQYLFPGETSRAFMLPEGGTGAAPKTQTDIGVVAATWLGNVTSHGLVDHLLLVAMLALGLRGRFLRAVGLLFVFHSVHAVTLAAAVAGWLPHAPSWMIAAYWIVLTCLVVLLCFFNDDRVSLDACLAATGLCHALNVPHLHLTSDSANFSSAFSTTGVMFAVQLAALVVITAVLALWRRIVSPRREREHRFA